MLNLQTIVVPTDFSDRSAAVASHARILSTIYDARIILLHVLQPVQVSAEGIEVPAAALYDWRSGQRPILEARLLEFADMYLKNRPVISMVRDGDPATEIIEVAREEKADLILLPTHGHGAFRRFLLGSVAAKVLHDAHTPVITGTHIDVPVDEAEHIHTVLVAVDLGRQAPILIKAAAAISKELKAELHVVHATPDAAAGATRFMDPAWRTETEQRMHAEVEKWIAETGVPAMIHFQPGSVSDVVRKVAEQTKAGLVIIGRHMDKSLLGGLRTHAYSIVRESPCPVLSL